MAGTITHFFVMKKYLEEKRGINVTYAHDNPLWGSYFLGSTGPDIFYMKGDFEHISDFHHYKNAGLFVKNLVETNPQDLHVKFLAMGFLCHMATDLVLHPFVNSLVGKYQEHIVTSIEIPGLTIHTPNDINKMTLSKKMVAHNMVEFAQDYYVHTYIWKNNSVFKAHSSIFTYGIDPVIPKLSKVLSETIKKSYDINAQADDIESILAFYGTTYMPIGVNIEGHVDQVLDDEYINYQIFLQHKNDIHGILDNENSTFMKLIDKAVEITEMMIKKMEAGKWDDILRPWNLDTGLYTEPIVKDNKITLGFKKYENIWK